MKTLILALALAVGANARANLAEISVTGTGIVTTQPDCAEVSLTINTVAPTAQQASEQNARAKEELEKVIVGSLGLKASDLKTTSLTRGPVHEYVNNRSVLKGQGVNHSLTLKLTKLDMVARVFDVLSTVKVSSVESITYDTSKRKELQLQAKRLAYADALANAQAYAAEAALSGLKPSKISEESYGGRAPRYEAARSANADGAETSINTDDLTITATVNVLFTTN